PSLVCRSWIADPWVHAPAVRGAAHCRPPVCPSLRLCPCGHARPARLADLRGYRRQHRRPGRRARPPGATRVREIPHSRRTVIRARPDRVVCGPWLLRPPVSLLPVSDVPTVNGVRVPVPRQGELPAVRRRAFDSGGNGL